MMTKIEDSKIRYFAYARKSSEDKERQALSIPTQKEKLEEQFPGLDVEFISEEKSAFTPHHRPVFEDMMKRLDKGERQGLIAWHPDRLSRNEIDASAISYRIRTGVIKDLKFGTYHFENSPEGIWMLQMALSQSQYESAKKGRDVKRGLEKKRKMGWLPGVAPGGYRNTPDKLKGFKTIVVDKKRFQLLRKAIDYLLTRNYTPPEVWKMLNSWGYTTVKRKKSGGEPMSRSGFYKFLTSPFYYGWFESPPGSGNWQKGEHKAMMTQEEFDRIQVLLGRPGKPAPHTREFAYTGLMTCGECKSAITAEEKNQLICSQCKYKFAYENKDKCPKCETLIAKMKKPVILKYIYYRCTKKRGVCSQPYVGIKVLETQINKLLADIEINQKYLDWALKHLQKAHEIESSTRLAVQKSQQEAFNNVSKKLDRILEMRMSEQITDEEYAVKKSSLLKEKERFVELIKDSDQRQNKWLELSERTFNFARFGKKKFETGTLRQKKDIFASLGSNLTIKDRKLNVKLLEPILILKRGLATVPQARATLEPKILRSNKGERASFNALNPHWLRRLDSNQRPSP